MKSWIEQIFDVKVKGINSSRVRTKKKRTGLNSTGKKKMIIRLRSNFSIPLFIN
uniref:Ribosomal protein L23 n=1 Tax=Drynaria acuminata TaxID=2784197 RepID=A0A872YNV5_9MONI|nr:ribosomal protein L23 [Drynaria acuminata]QOY24968.1 ribosomal protein L23 [Drynaria acuminata]